MNISGKVYRKSVLIIILMALLVAVLQGNPYTSVVYGVDRQPQIAAFFAISLLFVCYFVKLFISGKLSTERKILWIVFFGTLMRTFYVLFNDIWTLQNDGGTFTGFGTPDINNGHIGYIEYIYKFFHLPDMDPYDHFGYYHPPLHHIIEAIWLTVQRLIGVPEALAFENLQVPTLIYSSLCIVVMLHILEECRASEKGICFGMALFAFHPRMMVLAGSVNNDILALLLLLTTIWRTLVWIREKSFKNIVLIALSLGFGMVSKLNTAICAFSIALVFLCYLIWCIRDGNLIELKDCILEYLLFGVIVIPLGLSYIIRNLILFGEKPGIPSPALIPSESVMYTGTYSVWSIIGIPGIADLHVEFPFHPISAASIHNSWVILFQTGLFAEAFPAEINDYLLAFAQIAYVASIIAAIVTSVAFFVCYFAAYKERDTRLRTTFVLFTYIFMIISYSLFVFKYPYTCSSDFRYMTASLVFTSLGLVKIQGGFAKAGIYQECSDKEGISQDESKRDSVAKGSLSKGSLGQDGVTGTLGRVIRFVTNTAVILTLVCSAVVYMFWDLH